MIGEQPTDELQSFLAAMMHEMFVAVDRQLMEIHDEADQQQALAAAFEGVLHRCDFQARTIEGASDYCLFDDADRKAFRFMMVACFWGNYLGLRKVKFSDEFVPLDH